MLTANPAKSGHLWRSLKMIFLGCVSRSISHWVSEFWFNIDNLFYSFLFYYYRFAIYIGDFHCLFVCITNKAYIIINCGLWWEIPFWQTYELLLQKVTRPDHLPWVGSFLHFKIELLPFRYIHILNIVIQSSSRKTHSQ